MDFTPCTNTNIVKYYIQGNSANEWFPMKQWQIDALIKYHPIGGQGNYFMNWTDGIIFEHNKYKYVFQTQDGKNYYLKNINTNMIRLILIHVFPKHNGSEIKLYLKNEYNY